MQLNHAFLLSIFSLFTLNSLACEQQNYSDELICSGTFKAKTLVDIETYKTNPTHALKNLAIAFNLEVDESLEVHTPCQVRFLSTNAVNTTGDLCIDARNGIYVQTGYNFRASDVNLFSKKRIVFAPEVNVNVRDLSLITNGDSIESRAHIRHNSIVNARNLTLQAQQRVTLGYESTFNITEKLTLNSDLEFSGIWRDTTVNAAIVDISSNNLITLAGNVQINAPIYSATAAECKIPQTSTKSLSGNCNDTTRPKVRLKAFETNILKDTTLTFDTSRSLAPNGIKQLILKVNTQILSSNAYTFTSPGVYYIEAILIDNKDFKSSIKRKVVVKEEYKKDLRAYFRYGVEDEVLTLTYMQNIAKEQVSNAKFKIYDKYGVTLLEERILSNVYHLDSVEVEGLSSGTHKVGLEILKIDNEIVIYEQDVFVGSNLEVSNALPLLDFDLYQSGPKEVFLDARRILDPYHNFKEIIVDWGDEESESFEPDFLIGEKHLYKNIGTFEVKVTGIKENENGQEVIHEVIKQVTVTNESVPSMAPIASFYYDVNDNFPHVTFNINLVRSPTSNIGNIKFDFGDGQVFEGTPENFPEIHTHFYDPGVYIATLSATDSEGLSTSLSARIVMTESGPPLVTALNCEVLEGTSVTCETALVDKYKEITSASLNWGDGTSSDLEVINGEWLWDNFDHNFSSTGIYNIEVVVNTIRGQTATRNLSFEIKDQNTNPPPLFLNCTTNYLNLTCNAFTDFENASRLQKIDFYLNGEVVQSGTNSTFNFTASENRVINIYAIGDFGEHESKTDIEYLELKEEIKIIPIVDFDCNSNQINKVSCYNTSTNIDNTYQLIWIVEGSEFNSDVLNYEFFSGGEKQITLKLISSKNEIYELAKSVIVQENKAPIVNSLTCLETSVAKIDCTAIASDPEGQDLQVKWYVNGTEVVNNNRNLKIENFVGLSANIEFRVIDTFSSSSSMSKEVNVIPFFVKSSFSCKQTENFVAQCSSEGSSISQFSETVYNWKVDGEFYSNAKEIEISKELAGTISVELEVSLYNGQVKDTQSKNFVFEQLPNSSFDSMGKIEAAFDFEKFQEKNSLLKFIVKDISLSADQRLSSLVTINGEYLDQEKILILGNEITLDLELQDGKNIILISALDEEGKTLQEEFTTYAGSRNIEVNVLDSLDSNHVIELYSIDHKDVVFRHEFSGSSTTIQNISDLDFVVLLKNTNTTRMYQYLRTSSDVLVANLLVEEVQLNEDNLDFSKGLENWNVLKGEMNISESSGSNLDVIKPNVNVASLTPDENGEVLLKSNFKFLDNGRDNQLYIPSYLQGQDLESFYTIRLTNRRNNLSELTILRKKDVSNLGSGGNDGTLSSIDASDGDIIELEIYAKFYGPIESTSFWKNFLEVLVDNSFANISEISNLLIGEISSRIRIITDRKIYLKDGQVIGIGENISHIVSGMHDPEYNRIDPISGETKFDYLLNFHVEPRNMGLKFEVKICSPNPFGVPLVNHCNYFPLRKLVTENEWLFFIRPGQTNDLFFSTISIVVSNEIGDTVEERAVINREGTTLFSPFINLSWLMSNHNFPRYGALREIEDGGDSWVSAFHSTLFGTLINLGSFEFIKDNGELEIQTLKMNDASFSGFTNSHQTHKNGIEADYRFLYSAKEEYSDIYKGNSSGVHNFQDAKSIESVLNSVSGRVERIRLTNFELTKFEDGSQTVLDETTDEQLYLLKSPLAQYTYSSCLNSGELMNRKLIHIENGHLDHFHLKLFGLGYDNQVKKDHKKRLLQSAEDQTNLVTYFPQTKNESPFYKIRRDRYPMDANARIFMESAMDYNRGLTYALPPFEQESLPIYLSEDEEGFKVHLSEQYFASYVDSLTKESQYLISKNGADINNLNYKGKKVPEDDTVRKINPEISLKFLFYNNDGCLNYARGSITDSLKRAPVLKGFNVLNKNILSSVEGNPYKRYSFELELEVDAGFRNGDNSVDIERDIKDILLGLDYMDYSYESGKIKVRTYQAGFSGETSLDYLIYNRIGATSNTALSDIGKIKVKLCNGSECCVNSASWSSEMGCYFDN